MLTKFASNTYYNLILISLLPTFLIVTVFWALKTSLPKTKIRLIRELLSIGIMVFCLSFFIFYLIDYGLSELFEVSDHVRETIPDERTYGRFLVPAITILSWAAFFISLAKFSKVELTKLRRIVLLILCFLPIALAAFTIVIEPKLNNWLIIRLAIISSLPCWILNSFAILTGKTLSQLIITVLYRLHLLP